MKKTSFGHLANGTEVLSYRIENNCGEYAEILNYGGILHSLVVKNGNGEMIDVVLGADSAETMGRTTSDGMLVGRCTNRIKDGIFSINGHEFHLKRPNPNMQFLHSGESNYGRQFFTVEETGKNNSVVLHLEDEGTVGYECLVHATITYTMTEEHALVIDYHLETEGDTLLNPTNHAYFNIGTPDVRNCILQIPADTYAKRAESGMPEGEILPVEGTEFDFRKPIHIGEAMNVCGRNYDFDDNFIVNGEGYREAAVLTSPEAKLSMHVMTDMPGMVLFIRHDETPVTGKGGKQLTNYASVCLETQYISNAVNCEGMKKPIFLKGEKLDSRTAFVFTTN